MSAARESGDCDVRALARALAADVIAVRCLPAWPVADAALLRLVGVAAGTRGLGAPDAATRQARAAPCARAAWGWGVAARRCGCCACGGPWDPHAAKRSCVGLAVSHADQAE